MNNFALLKLDEDPEILIFDVNTPPPMRQPAPMLVCWPALFRED